VNTQTIKARCPEAPERVEQIAGVIRGDASALRGCVDADAAFADAAQAHGVHGLVTQALRANELWHLVLPETRAALNSHLRHTALSDRYFRRQTIRAVTALREAGIPILTFKGEAIACTHYPRPHLRPRCDTDLLVAKRDASAAARVLEALGYRPVNMVAREVVHTQQVFSEIDGAMRHVIDLHWGVSNRPPFAGVFTFDELARDAVEIGPIPGMPAPNPVHALLLACLHRVTHHENSVRLVWLYDIALLAGGLSDKEWEQVRRIAFRKALCGVCATGIEMAASFFRCSPRTFSQVATLHALGRKHDEPSLAYLGARRGPLRRILLDARHTGSLPRTIQLLASHAFPDAAYMRRTYGARNPLSLARSYAYRAARGVRRLVP